MTIKNTFHVEKVHYAGQSEEYDSPDESLICDKCGSEIRVEDCQDCDGGYSYHDCGEDTCCCLDDSPNVVCHNCSGSGCNYFCDKCKTYVEKSDD